MNYLEYLQNPIVLGIIIGIFSVILSLIDDKLNNIKVLNKKYYFKQFILTAGIVAVLVYFSNKSLNTVVSKVKPVKMTGGTAINMDNIDTGLPDF